MDGSDRSLTLLVPSTDLSFISRLHFQGRSLRSTEQETSYHIKGRRKITGLCLDYLEIYNLWRGPLVHLHYLDQGEGYSSSQEVFQLWTEI